MSSQGTNFNHWCFIGRKSTKTPWFHFWCINHFKGSIWLDWGLVWVENCKSFKIKSLTNFQPLKMCTERISSNHWTIDHSNTKSSLRNSNRNNSTCFRSNKLLNKINLGWVAQRMNWREETLKSRHSTIHLANLSSMISLDSTFARISNPLMISQSTWVTATSRK